MAGPCHAPDIFRPSPTCFVKFGEINKKYFSGGVANFGGAWPTPDVARASDFLGCIGKKFTNFLFLLL